MMVMLIYMDDLLLTSYDPTMIYDTKETLQNALKIKDLGELRCFLGLEFARNEAGILMHQRKYELKLITDIWLAGAKHVSTPMEMNQKLTTVEFDANIPSSQSDPPLSILLAIKGWLVGYYILPLLDQTYPLISST